MSVFQEHCLLCLSGIVYCTGTSRLKVHESSMLILWFGANHYWMTSHLPDSRLLSLYSSDDRILKLYIYRKVPSSWLIYIWRCNHMATPNIPTRPQGHLDSWVPSEPAHWCQKWTSSRRMPIESSNLPAEAGDLVTDTAGYSIRDHATLVWSTAYSWLTK